MKVAVKVTYCDGTEEYAEIEKPHGAHPDSWLVLAAAIAALEKAGKEVQMIGRSTINPFSTPPHPMVFNEGQYAREFVLAELSSVCSSDVFTNVWQELGLKRWR